MSGTTGIAISSRAMRAPPPRIRSEAVLLKTPTRVCARFSRSWRLPRLPAPSRAMARERFQLLLGGLRGDSLLQLGVQGALELLRLVGPLAGGVEKLPGQLDVGAQGFQALGDRAHHVLGLLDGLRPGLRLRPGADQF